MSEHRIVYAGDHGDIYKVNDLQREKVDETSALKELQDA